MTAFDRAWELVKEAWDSTCDKCGFNYYNEEGEGPRTAMGDDPDQGGEHGWINESDFDLEMDEVAPDIQHQEVSEDWYQFHNWLQERMLRAGWENICGKCRDGLHDDYEATRRNWA